MADTAQDLLPNSEPVLVVEMETTEQADDSCGVVPVTLGSMPSQVDTDQPSITLENLEPTLETSLAELINNNEVIVIVSVVQRSLIKSS